MRGRGEPGTAPREPREDHTRFESGKAPAWGYGWPYDYRYGTCDVPVCDRYRSSPNHGYCQAHATQWKRRRGPVANQALRRYAVDNVLNYHGVHSRLVRERGKASEHCCADCGADARDWSWSGAGRPMWSDYGAPYSQDLDDYEPRCKSCHVSHDSGARRRYRAQYPDRPKYPSLYPVPRYT